MSEASSTDSSNQVRERLVVATVAQEHIARTLADLEQSSHDERDRRRMAEEAGAQAREQLRAAEARTRVAEVAELQVRLQFEAGREALLVELGGIGGDGLRALLADRADAADIVIVPDPSAETEISRRPSTRPSSGGAASGRAARRGPR